MQTLSEDRYQEMLRKVVFEVRLSNSKNAELVREQVSEFGARSASDEGSNGTDVAVAPEWEVAQFIERLGDMQHELGPPGLSDHLSTLGMSTSDVDFKRFHARTHYGRFPVYPKRYQLPIRSPDGYVYPRL